MTGLPSPGTPWFLTLPDADHLTESISPVAECAPRALRYRSGRPWLLGDWSDGTVVTAEAGASRLALIGCCPVTATHLTRALTRIQKVTALDDLLSSLPGSFHAVAEIDGHRRIQGTASGVRRVFHTVMNGQVIASDRADVLAACARGELDPTAVALSLLDPSAPYPLDDRPMWHGVEALAPDRFLLTGGDGWPRTVRWWRRPEPVLSLEAGARLLRDALTEAVAARAGAVGGTGTNRTGRGDRGGGGGTVSCDLSGGLGSTAVCFLAARSPVTLVAYTGIGRDPGDDDPEWVNLAMTDLSEILPGMVHEVLPCDELPLVYDGIVTADEALDRPFPGITDRAKILAGFHRVARHHPRIHLTGLGGDEVVQGAPNYLPTLLRRRPRTAVDRFHGFRIQHRWPLWASLLMFRPRDYRTYLAQMAAQVTDSRPMPGLADLDWADAPRLPGWLTPHAVTLVREAVEALVDSAAPPLAGTRDQHHDLLSIRTAAGATRLFCQLAAPTGVTPAAPFLDDRVIEASLTVRPDERTTPWEYKPLLKEAMRGIVPDHSLRRVTKAEGSAEEASGLDAHHDRLLALCENSRLADLGLVDPEKLRACCRYSYAPEREHESLHQTFACEIWLRALTGDRRAGHPLEAAC